MSVLDNIEPREVFRWFAEIAAIPHGSGNIRQISDYLVRFATDRGLPVLQDEMGNVLIRCAASEGREDEPTLILQGHMDMVCEKTADADIDMEKEGLKLRCDGEWVTAEGTSLGGDDGIALAYSMAILDSDEISHPALEVIFTVDEEIGMLGAAKLGFVDELKGRILLNIDMETEGQLICGCAGGVRVTGAFPLEWEDGIPPSMTPFRITIDGLRGGHSGEEVDKGRANAHILLGRLLQKLSDHAELRLAEVEGGSKDNVIPNRVTAALYGVGDELKPLVEECREVFQNELSLTDPDVSVRIEELTGADATARPVMTRDAMQTLIRAIRLLPNGIQRMGIDIPGQVQTSLNMGVLRIEEKKLILGFGLRSGVASEKEELVDRLTTLIRMLGGVAERMGDYPEWEFHADSPLRKHMCEIFERQYGYPPKSGSAHIGLECGFFCSFLPGLDAISFGPQVTDIHTPNEAMEIASVERTWKYLLTVLEEPIKA